MLVEQGIVACSRGRRMVGRAAAGDTDAAAASQVRLAGQIAADIENGTYRIGERLGKFTFFQCRYHVSPSTLTLAFDILQRKRLVHKQGKAWIAGPSPISATGQGRRISRSGAPVVVVVTGEEKDWVSAFVNFHTIPFMTSFYGAVSDRGYRFCIVQRVQTGQSFVPAGAAQIHDAITALGNRYQGTLMLLNAPHAGFAIEIARMLGSFKQPIVSFDFTNTQSGSARPAAPAQSAFHRLYFDEHAAVRMALKRLVEQGHRRIGVPFHGAQKYSWVERRLKAIADEAGRLSPSPALFYSEQREPIWDDDYFATIEGFRERIMFQTGRQLQADKRVSALRDKAVAAAPSLTTLIERHQVSALLALNDQLAREYFFWLKLAGKAIPHQLSLISFDNIPALVHFPITTIDFGFTRLGYLAAHRILGDIPVKCDRDGGVAGSCTLIDRGSVSRPAKAVARAAV
jgi:hypothetical protein